jgi:excinuclease Cho
MLHQCAGVSRGNESIETHYARLLTSLQAFKVMCWPYSGAVGLIERFEDLSQIHVIHNWCYLGSVSELKKAKELSVQASGFDADGYKILCKPILSGAVGIVVL